MAPKPYRTSSELSTASTATNSSSSSASSATLPCASPGPASPTTNFFSRIRNSRSRSPQPRSASTTSALPSPTTHRPERLHLRTDSSLSATSPTATSPRARSRPTKRNSTGTVMQVGRHGNEWLFGGFSFTETVRGLLSPSDSESGHDRN